MNNFEATVNHLLGKPGSTIADVYEFLDKSLEPVSVVDQFLFEKKVREIKERTKMIN